MGWVWYESGWVNHLIDGLDWVSPFKYGWVLWSMNPFNKQVMLDRSLINAFKIGWVGSPLNKV